LWYYGWISCTNRYHTCKLIVDIILLAISLSFFFREVSEPSTMPDMRIDGMRIMKSGDIRHENWWFCHGCHRMTWGFRIKTIRIMDYLIVNHRQHGDLTIWCFFWDFRLNMPWCHDTEWPFRDLNWRYLPHIRPIFQA